MMMKLARSEVPPWLMKGRVRPVRGITRVTPPTMTKACRAIEVVRPMAVRAETSVLVRAATAKPRTAKMK